MRTIWSNALGDEILATELLEGCGLWLLENGTTEYLTDIGITGKEILHTSKQGKRFKFRYMTNKHLTNLELSIRKYGEAERFREVCDYPDDMKEDPKEEGALEERLLGDPLYRCVRLEWMRRRRLLNELPEE